MRISDWSSDVCSSDLFMEARGVPGGDLQLGSEVEERQLSRQGLVLGESGADHIKAAALGTGVGQEAIAAENDAKAPDRDLHRCRQSQGALCHRNQSVVGKTVGEGKSGSGRGEVGGGWF